MKTMLYVVLVCITATGLWPTSADAQWTQVAVNNPGELLDVSFGSRDKVWAVGHSGNYSVVIRSTDGGVSWHGERHDAPVGKINRVFMRDTLTGYAVGDKGLVLKREWVPGTVGIQWHQLAEPMKDGLFAVSFPSDRVGWVAGHNDRLFATTDGGATWFEQAHDGEEWSAILDIFFLDEQRGWTAGYYPNRTTDGGRTWVRMTMPTETEWRGLHFVDQNLGFMVGRLGNIARTTDGGVTWSSIWSTTGVMLMSVDFVDDTEGWIVGGGINDGRWIDSSRVLHTVDGGLTWVQEQHPTDKWLNNIDVFGRENVLAVGGGGTMIQRVATVSVNDADRTSGGTTCAHAVKTRHDLLGRQSASLGNAFVLSRCETCGVVKLE